MPKRTRRATWAIFALCLLSAIMAWMPCVLTQPEDEPSPVWLPHDVDCLPNGNTLISCASGSEVVEVNSKGTIVWEYPTKGAQPAATRPRPSAESSALVTIDVDLPSTSTGSPTGILAVRVHTPHAGRARFPKGAPVIIWLQGGFKIKGINHGLPPHADDLIVVTFIYPGGKDTFAGRRSDGTYDYRGERCIQALRDVILYAAGKLRDSQGRTIDAVVPVRVLHGNIGLIGESNGGNIIVAVAALHGEELAGHLRYLIQWETPVSSQIATRDLGRVWMKPTPKQGDYWNPRYLSYGPMTLHVDYSDLTYDPSQEFYPVFHDGNGDGRYTITKDPRTGLLTPDLDLDGVLQIDEDFPVDTYPVDDSRVAYSRPATHALADNDVFAGAWPEAIATPEEANVYWDIRESVRLYEQALANIPDLQGMVLANVRDHVQAMPGKPHVRQAFAGWNDNGAWVQINPSPDYMIEADPSLATRTDLPDNAPNTAPADWTYHLSYAVPVDIPKPIYELAAIYQMADQILIGGAGASADTVAMASALRAAPTRPRDELITYVKSEDIGRIAVQLWTPSLGSRLAIQH